MQLRRSIALKAQPDQVPDFKLRGDQYYAFMSGGVAVQNAVLDLSTRDYQVMFYEPSYCRSFAIPFFCCCYRLHRGGLMLLLPSPSMTRLRKRRTSGPALGRVKSSLRS